MIFNASKGGGEFANERKDLKEKEAGSVMPDPRGEPRGREQESAMAGGLNAMRTPDGGGKY